MTAPVTGVRVWLFDDRISIRHAVGVRFGEGGPGGAPGCEAAAPTRCAEGGRSSSEGEGSSSEGEGTASKVDFSGCDELCAFDVSLEPGFGVYLCAQECVDLDLVLTLGRRFPDAWEANSAAVAVAGLARCTDWTAEIGEDGACEFPATEFALACRHLERIAPRQTSIEKNTVRFLEASAAASAAQQLARDTRWAKAIDSADGAVVLVLNPSLGAGWGAFAEDWLRNPLRGS